MHPVVLLLTFTLLILPVSCTYHFIQPGRRVCSRDVRQQLTPVSHTESFVQAVHKPYMTLCDGKRLCSTYKTVYRVSYRQVTSPEPPSYSECCPGWRRVHSHNCNQAVCMKPCMNGGTCVRPNQCACAAGWTGRYCQTDIDECNGSHSCAQQCINIVGSYQCGCQEGYQLDRDGHSCEALELSSPNKVNNIPKLSSTTADEEAGHSNKMTEEVQNLRTRVEMLEQKLQLALAPFNSLFSLMPEDGVAERASFLSHSFQQLDRIDSLSEQIGFLEERLETCSCRDNR
ncbi:epidermal growth factor-like protein 7 [Lepisosteus oculatus]|uniref:epidermal growth factor-like protein 7 n=1 Tax=Lepisosteus oculatus TaxID=7918 RepID=UPI003715B724